MHSLCFLFLFFFFKQKTAYEMRISDWSSDVCSSDLLAGRPRRHGDRGHLDQRLDRHRRQQGGHARRHPLDPQRHHPHRPAAADPPGGRSEEHTSELQSLMRISYAVFCLKKKKKHKTITPNDNEITNEINYEFMSTQTQKKTMPANIHLNK